MCFLQQINAFWTFCYFSPLHSNTKKTALNLPLSDGWIKSLPIRCRNSVVVIEILLMVLLDSSCISVSWFLSGKNISSHLLLLFGLQGNDFIANWRQFAVATAAAISFLRALLRPVLDRLWKHQEEGETFHVLSFLIYHEYTRV